MPRVVIELQANTQQAIAQIQAFARAQRDAFDAIKAGNPQLADATVKVSKLTESTKLSAHAANEFNSAAKNLAAGGVRDLIGQVPILGNAVASLAGNLKGLPLALVAAGSAVLGVVSYLKDLEAQMLKTADATTALSEKAQRNFLDMTRRVAAMQAEAAGRPETAAALRFGDVKRGAELLQEEELKAAKKTREGAIGLVDKLQAPFNMQAFADKLTIANSAYQQARVDADEKASNTITEAREKFKLALQKIETDLDTSHAASQEKRVQDAAAAAEKQKQIVEALTASSLATFKGLGAGFEDVVKSLELAQFVSKTTEQIATLNAGIEAGLDTHGRFAAGIRVLQEKMAEAIQLGYVPMAEAATKTTEAVKASGEAAVQAGHDYQQMAQDAMTAAQALAALNAQGRAGGGGGGPAPSGDVFRSAEQRSTLATERTNTAYAESFASTLREATSTLDAYDRTKYTQSVPSLNTSTTTPSTPSTPARSGRYMVETLPGGTTSYTGFQHGGVVPGSGPVPIIAHGGEVVVPTSPGRVMGRGGGGGTTVVRIEAGAVQVSGTIVEQQRGWDVLVEELGAALEARLR